MPPRQSTASEPPATPAGHGSDNSETKEEYCLCRGTDDGRPMVSCDNCNNWFHFACIALDQSTAAELETYVCANCAEIAGQKSTYSWELTDDELTFATSGPPEQEPQSPLVEKAAEAAPNPKRRQSIASKAKSETPKPSVIVPAPTFAPPESDSDFEMKEDDEEYTEERRRARKKNARRVAESDSSESGLDTGRSRILSGVKRKANTLGGGTPNTAKRKRVSHNHSSSQQIPSDPMTDPLRKHFHDKLKEIMAKIFVEYRATEDDEEVSEERAIELSVLYAKALEAAVFEACAEINATRKRAAGQSYRTRCMTLTFNLSQDDRTELHSRIGTLSLPAQELAVMPSSELANDAFKQKMEKIALQQLAQTTLKSVDTSRPRAKITHKGEELIDSYVHGPETSGAIEVEDKMDHRQPLRLDTNLSGDGVGVPSSAIEQTPASATMAVMDTPASAIAESVMNEPAPASSTVAAGETSLLPPVVATHSQAEDLSGAGSGEVQSPTVPTSAILSARPAFDLNSLWSGAEGGQPPSASVDNDVELLGGNEDEAEMDLDVGGDEVAGGVGDDDFAMFLEGVDEAKAEGASRNVVGAPPGLRQRKPSESDMDNFEKLPVVWSGDLTLPLDPNPAITAAVKVRQVAGRDLGTSALLWKPLLTHSKKGCVWIEGRVSTDRSTKYLMTARMNAGKELIAVMLVPDEKDENARVKFGALVDTLIKKDRHGLVFPWGTQPPSSAPGRDMYLIPLKPSSALPEFIELLDRASSVPKRRERDAILGVYVLTKGKLVVPPPTPPVPVATPVPAAPPPAVANLIQSQGGISSLLSSVFGSLPPQPGPPQPIPAFAPPPQPVQMQPPPTSTLAALSSDLQNLTPEQISLILQGLSGKAALPPSLPQPQPQPQGWPVPYPGATPIPQPYPPAIPPSNAAYPPHGQSPLGRSPLQHTVYPDRAARMHPEQRPYPGSSPRRERDRDRDGAALRTPRRGGHSHGRSRDDNWRRGERERDDGWASRRAAAGR